MSVYVISGFLNLIHIKKSKNFDYIVVLGAGIIGKRVTPLLASRIEKGISLLRKNPHAKIIMSGGQGEGEDIAEGEAMAQYAIDKGVNPERIIKTKWYFTLNALIREFIGYLSVKWKIHAAILGFIILNTLMVEFI